jgi:hypothetical protein
MIVFLAGVIAGVLLTCVGVAVALRKASLL